MVWYCQRVSLHFCQLLKHVLNIFSVIYIGSSLKLGTGANSDPGKFAHGFISPLSKILRFAPFPQVPTHVQQQDSLVFTGRWGFFFTIGILHFKCFFLFKWCDSRSLPRQISFFLIFSGICSLSWPCLSSEFLGGWTEKQKQSIQKFQEHVRSVASRACQKFQEHVRSVASRACQKFQEHPLNYIRSRVPRPPGFRGPGSRVLPGAL